MLPTDPGPFWIDVSARAIALCLILMLQEYARPREPPSQAAKLDVGLKADEPPFAILKRLGSDRFRHGRTLTSVVFFPDSETIASGSLDGTISLWEVPSGKEIRRLKTSGQVDCLALSQDRKQIAVGGTVVSVWDVQTGKKLWESPDLKASMKSIIFAPDGNTLASGGTNSTIVVWDAKRGGEIQKFPIHSDVITSLLYSHDGSWLASASWDKTIRISDAKTGEPRRILRHPGQVTSLALSPDGKTLASGAWDIFDKNPPEIKMWSVDNGTIVRSISLPRQRNPFRKVQQQISCLSYSPDGVRVAASAEGWVYVFESQTGALSWSHRVNDSFIKVIRHSPNGHLLAYGGTGNTVHLLNSTTGEERDVTAGHRGGVNCVAISSDGRTMISGGDDHSMRVWDILGGKVLWQRSGFEAPVSDIVLSPDDTLLASGANKVYIWKLENGNKVSEIGKYEAAVRALALSTDGRSLAFAGISGLSIWDVTTGRVQHNLSWGINPFTTSLSFSPDGKILASGDFLSLQFPVSAGNIRLWSTKTGNQLRQWKAHEEGIVSVRFSSDGKTLASVGGGPFALKPGNVALWNSETGRPLRSLNGHTTGVVSIAFSPDGRSLASGYLDGTIRLWEVASGEERCKLASHGGSVQCLAFSADGKILVSGSSDTTILVWALNEATLDELKSIKTESIDTLWKILAQQDGITSYRAIWKLVQAGAPAAIFIKEKLKPISSADSRHVEDLIQKLDANDFLERENATKDLERIGGAEAALLKACSEKPSQEAQRRMERVLVFLNGSQRLQANRALEVLELIGNQEAKDVLKSLSQGAPGAWLTREAQASLSRVEKRHASAAH